MLEAVFAVAGGAYDADGVQGVDEGLALWMRALGCCESGGFLT